MIELKSGQLWVYVRVWRPYAGTQWEWSYQLGEDANEIFTGIASTRRYAVRNARRHAKKTIKKMIVTKIAIEEYDET